MTVFVFHLPGSALRDPGLMKPYYVKVTEGLRARGFDVASVVHDRALVPAQVEADAAFHIVDHGAHRHPRLLNTGIAYVYPFWHLDPWGIRAASSIAEKPFSVDGLDPDEARAFAERLRKRLVTPRRSRYEQPRKRADLPAGSIAVFLQSEAHRGVSETCHLSLREMVKAVIARDDPRPIVIKPHPRDADPATRRFLNRVAGRDARVLITDANIHDILAKAAVCVTINSAVGIEAMMHHRPVVLCGRADFHHCATTVTSAVDLDRALTESGQTDRPYDAYLYWYFGLNCLSAGQPSLVEDFLARIRATGYALG
jgi:hypothetical protein